MKSGVVNTLFDAFRDDLTTNDIAQFRGEIDRWIVSDETSEPNLNHQLFRKLWQRQTAPYTQSQQQQLREALVLWEELKLTSGRRQNFRNSEFWTNGKHDKNIQGKKWFQSMWHTNHVNPGVSLYNQYTRVVLIR